MADQGEHIVLARWYYARDEWERFLAAEWHSYSLQYWRSIRFTAWRLLAAIAIMAILTLVVGGWLAGIFIFVCVGTVAGFFLGGLALVRFVLERNRNRRLRLASPEVTITPDWLLFGDPSYPQMCVYNRLTGSGRSVTAKVEGGDPPTLCIVVYRRNQGGLIEEIRIPVPSGHQDEALAVVTNRWWTPGP